MNSITTGQTTGRWINDIQSPTYHKHQQSYCCFIDLRNTFKGYKRIADDKANNNGNRHRVLIYVLGEAKISNFLEKKNFCHKKLNKKAIIANFTDK
jgi:hypothetical protein